MAVVEVISFCSLSIFAINYEIMNCSKKSQVDESGSNAHIQQLLKIVKAYEEKKIVQITGEVLPIILETLKLNVILSFSRQSKRPSLLL